MNILHIYFFSISIGHRDPIQTVDDPNYNRNSRLNNWVDINEEDMKLFMVHVIVMGLIRKPNVTKYWSRNPIISTPSESTWDDCILNASCPTYISVMIQ